MDGFPFVHRETARFRDLDPMRHANNAVCLTWIDAYGYATNSSKEIPEEWRQRLAA